MPIISLQLSIFRPFRGFADCADYALLGKETAVLAGDAAINFIVPRHGHSTFEAGVAPLILFR